MAVSPEQIAAWARGIGLAQCVGEEFVQQFGRLPNSEDDLNSWGNSTGRRSSTGSWTCKGSAPAPGPGPAPGPTPGLPGGSGDIFGQIISLVKANPIPAAVVGYLLLSRRR